MRCRMHCRTGDPGGLQWNTSGNACWPTIDLTDCDPPGPIASRHRSALAQAEGVGAALTSRGRAGSR